MQGGAVQGIGWALNEEYIYGKDGRLQNAGFLDYRIPVASDLPMIEPVILEIPNPGHPYGVRGVGEKRRGKKRKEREKEEREKRTKRWLK